MMKIKGSSKFAIGLMAVMLVVIIWASTMPYYESKLLPITLGSGIFILSAIQLGRELKGKAQKEVGVTEVEGAETTGVRAEESDVEKMQWMRYLLNGAWLVGFAAGIYLLGFYLASPLFILFYMKWLGTRWVTGIFYAIISTLILYGVFETLLQVRLYRGLFFGGYGY